MIRKITKRVIATTLALTIAITPLTNLKINNQPQEAQAASASDMTGAKLWSGGELLKKVGSKSTLGKQIAKLNKDYKDDVIRVKDGKKLIGAYYLTWTSTNRQADPKVEKRWRTIGHYITPNPVKYSSNTPTYLNRKVYYKPNYRIKKSDGIRVDSTKKFQYTESTKGDMVTTRYVLSYNYVTKEIVKWNDNSDIKDSKKFKPLEGDAGWEVYVQPIIEAYNAETKKIYKTDILSVEDWVNALGSGIQWTNSTTFHTNYNKYYEWHAEPTDPKKLQVHYIKSGSQTTSSTNGEELQSPTKVIKTNDERVTLGGYVKTIQGESVSFYKDVIQDDEGNYWVLSQYYVIDTEKEKIEQDNVDETRELITATGIQDAINDPSKKVKITKDNRNRTLNSTNLKGKSLTYEKYEEKLKTSKFKLSIKTNHLFLCYEPVDYLIDATKDNAPGTPDYKVRVLYEYQYYEDGKYVWKTAKSPEYLNDVDVFSRVFPDTLKDEARPYYGLYSIEAVDDSTKETIPNEVLNSQSEVSDGNNYFYYDTARWKHYKSLVESTKYTVPKDSSITITVRYAARVPYVQLMYTATKSENGEISYTLTNSRLGTTDERHCPGETVTVSFPSLAADGTAYAYGYGSSGSVAGYGGATDNGWTINSLPIASTDASAKTRLTLVCPEEPLYAVGVYGEIGMPAVDPTPPEPIVVPPPAPNYTDSNYPSLQWNHHGGCVHVKDDKDSTAGSAAINQNFNCEIRVIFII